MLHANEIILKLKEKLGYKSDLELSKLMGVKPNTISSWKTRNTLQFETVIKICQKYRIDLNELFFSNPSPFFYDELEKRRVKMISVDHQFEYFVNPEKCCAASPSSAFPTEEEIDIAFQIGAENMYPTIKVSSYVLTKRIELSEIQPWHIYLLVIKERGILCYRFKYITENGKYEFISDNLSYANLIIDTSEIKEIFSIKGAFLANIKNITEY